MGTPYKDINGSTMKRNAIKFARNAQTSETTTKLLDMPSAFLA